MRRVLGGLVAIGWSASAWAAEFVATVIGVEGSVAVELPSGAWAPLTIRDGLTEQDIVHTGDDGVAVLLLRNDRVVRLDEEIDLRVGEIRELGAGAASQSVDEQLAALVPSGERNALGFDHERIAGWHARQAAGVNAPSSGSLAFAAGRPGLGAGSARRPSPPPPDLGATGGAASPVAAASRPAASQFGSPSYPPGGRRPSSLQRKLSADARPGRCLAAWVQAAPSPAYVRVTVDASGRIAAMTGEDGVALPGCAVDRWRGKRLAVEPGGSVRIFLLPEGASGSANDAR